MGLKKSASDLYLEKDAVASPGFVDRYFVSLAVRVAGGFVSAANANLPNLNHMIENISVQKFLFLHQYKR